MKFCGPGGIRTRGLFSAIEAQVGEKGKKLSITSIMFLNHHTVLAYLFPIVPELFPSMKQGKTTQSPVRRWSYKYLGALS